MENDNQDKIYIKTDEEVPSIISRIKNSAKKEIILVVPHDALILNNVLNLKVLKREAEELNKNILVLAANDNSEAENENAKAEPDAAKREKINLVSSIIKPDIFSKTEKDLAADVSLKKGGKFNARASFKNKTNLDLSSAGSFAETDRSKKIKMFDIVKKVNDPDEINKGEYELAEEKENHREISDRQKDFSRSGDSAEFQTEDKSTESVIKTSRKITILPSLSSKIVALFIFISFVAVSLAVAFILPKADINIILKKEIAAYDFEFMADESLDKIDAVNSKIPLEKIEIASEESESYPTTGKKHMQEKASGEITVFNEYSSSPQRLVADSVNGYTRFLSKDGKLFRIKEAVTIPGFSRVEGVDVPGQVTIKIYADEVGEKYNIGPDSFHLPGLQGSAKYASIYARSTKAMSGGMDKEVSYFSESDYMTAKENLLKLAKEKNDKDFLNKVPDQSQRLKDIKEEEKNVKIATDVEIGDVADNFKMNVIVKTSAVFILDSDLNKIIDEKINSRLDTNKKLLDNNRSYEVGEVKISEDEKIAVPVHIDQGLIIKVDIEKMKKDMAGKNEAELKSYFSNMSGVKSTNISFWPFWVKSVPSSYEKINIAIDINDSV